MWKDSVHLLHILLCVFYKTYYIKVRQNARLNHPHFQTFCTYRVSPKTTHKKHVVMLRVMP
ncbi:unknown [Salmonella phage FelixO1]|uniref:Uncharacterized protein n=1 Tax=Salmonella phage Felix O1 (isolate Felix O1-VT1) TaxID=1283336 RepID=Q6KGU5_BPFO1|nr:unknown [Salmonella phage FelixO1]